MNMNICSLLWLSRFASQLSYCYLLSSTMNKSPQWSKAISPINSNNKTDDQNQGINIYYIILYTLTKDSTMVKSNKLYLCIT